VIVLRGLGWLVAALVIAAASGWLHLSTSLACEAAKAMVEGPLSDRFRGELTVESVETVAWGHAVVKGFQVRDLDDVAVLSVERGELVFEPLPLLFGGTVTLRDVVAEGGRLVLRPGQERSVSIAEAFASTGPDDGGPSRALDLGWMVAHDLDLRVALTNPALVFHVDAASVQLVREEGGDVEVDLANVDAAMREPSALGASIRIAGASGEVRPGSDPLLSLDSGACLGSHPLRVRVRYRKGPPRAATLTLDYRDGVGFLASVALRVVARFSGTLEIDEEELPGESPDC